MYDHTLAPTSGGICFSAASSRTKKPILLSDLYRYIYSVTQIRVDRYLKRDSDRYLKN